MARRKPDEVPYEVLTKAQEREIENIDRNPIPYSMRSELGDYQGVQEVELKYRGSKYAAYNYLNEDGESVGVALRKGATTIITNLQKLAKTNQRHYEDLLLAAKLKYEEKVTF